MQESTLQGAVAGYQGLIRGKSATSNDAGLLNDPTPLGTLATGTYYFRVPVAGASAVDVTLRTTATGASGTRPTPTIYKVLADQFTEKMNATGTSAAVSFAILVDGTEQTASITNLRGERFVMLKIVVAASSTVVFDQAEYSAL